MLDSATSALNQHLAKDDEYSQIVDQFDTELCPLIDELSTLLSQYENETGYDLKEVAISITEKIPNLIKEKIGIARHSNLLKKEDCCSWVHTSLT